MYLYLYMTVFYKIFFHMSLTLFNFVLLLKWNTEYYSSLMFSLVLITFSDIKLNLKLIYNYILYWQWLKLQKKIIKQFSFFFSCTLNFLAIPSITYFLYSTITRQLITHFKNIAKVRTKPAVRTYKILVLITYK